MKQDEFTVREIMLMIREWWKHLLNQWWKILIVGLLGGIAGVTLAWFSPVRYSSNLSFILEEGKASSGLSAITSELGLDIGGMGGSSNMLSGENIVGLLRSKKFVKQVLLTPYDSAYRYSLADRYADVNELREGWVKSNPGGKAYFPPGNNTLSRFQDSLLHLLSDMILDKELNVYRPDKKMSFFAVSLESRDELLSKYFSERLVKTVISFYIEAKTRRLRTNVDRLQRRADSIGGLLNSRTYKTAAAQSQSLDINPAYQTASVAVELSMRDKVMLSTIYGELVKNLEIQKALLSQETPVIEIIDESELPLPVRKASKKMHFISGFMLFSFILMIFFVFKYQFKKTA